MSSEMGDKLYNGLLSDLKKISQCHLNDDLFEDNQAEKLFFDNEQEFDVGLWSIFGKCIDYAADNKEKIADFITERMKKENLKHCKDTENINITEENSIIETEPDINIEEDSNKGETVVNDHNGKEVNQNAQLNEELVKLNINDKPNINDKDIEKSSNSTKPSKTENKKGEKKSDIINNNKKRKSKYQKKLESARIKAQNYVREVIDSDEETVIMEDENSKIKEFNVSENTNVEEHSMITREIRKESQNETINISENTNVEEHSMITREIRKESQNQTIDDLCLVNKVLDTKLILNDNKEIEQREIESKQYTGTKNKIIEPDNTEIQKTKLGIDPSEDKRFIIESDQIQLVNSELNIQSEDDSWQDVKTRKTNNSNKTKTDILNQEMFNKSVVQEKPIVKSSNEIEKQKTLYYDAKKGSSNLIKTKQFISNSNTSYQKPPTIAYPARIPGLIKLPDPYQQVCKQNDRSCNSRNSDSEFSNRSSSPSELGSLKSFSSDSSRGKSSYDAFRNMQSFNSDSGFSSGSNYASPLESHRQPSCRKKIGKLTGSNLRKFQTSMQNVGPIFEERSHQRPHNMSTYRPTNDYYGNSNIMPSKDNIFDQQSHIVLSPRGNEIIPQSNQIPGIPPFMKPFSSVVSSGTALQKVVHFNQEEYINHAEVLSNLTRYYEDNSNSKVALIMVTQNQDPDVLKRLKTMENTSKGIEDAAIMSRMRNEQELSNVMSKMDEIKEMLLERKEEDKRMKSTMQNFQPALQQVLPLQNQGSIVRDANGGIWQQVLPQMNQTPVFQDASGKIWQQLPTVQQSQQPITQFNQYGQPIAPSQYENQGIPFQSNQPNLPINIDQRNTDRFSNLDSIPFPYPPPESLHQKSNWEPKNKHNFKPIKTNKQPMYKPTPIKTGIAIPGIENFKPVVIPLNFDKDGKMLDTDSESDIE